MKEYEDKLREELGERLKTNISLKEFAGFKVGGPARYFFVAKTIDDLVKAVAAAHKCNLPYFVLGGGYNIVFSDFGYDGLVIKNECENIAFSDGNSQIIVDSGVSLGKLINLAASRELGGLEFLFGVPGTVGGAVYGNAGAFGYEIGDFVKNIIVLMLSGGELKIVKKDPEWLNFQYRSSHLKEKANNKGKPIILTIKLQMVKRRRDEILSMMQANLNAKKESQPLKGFSAGSFFKNVGTTPEQSAGYLIDKSGGKKLKVGGAAVSKKHANFIVNRNNATAADIKKLGERIKELVGAKFNYDIEEEVEYIGEWQ